MVTLGTTFETDAVLLRASPVLARAGLHIVSKGRAHPQRGEQIGDDWGSRLSLSDRCLFRNSLKFLILCSSL